jgi:5-methylcytosine-specific restriction endonuclease McrA
MRWFRFYGDAINDPKIIRMPGAMRWHWIAILCVASKNDGILPDLKDIAFGLRVPERKAQSIINSLLAHGLLDRIDEVLTPHNWSSRQYQSDSSAERVKRHREKRAAAGLTRQWAAPKELRRQVYERDNFACVYCGATEKLSLDHRTPEVRGGTHDIENLATACLSCNGAKRDLTEHEFLNRTVTVTTHPPLLKRPQTTEQNTEQKVSKRPTQKIPLPLDWRPPERSRVLASQLGLSIEPIEAQFRDYLASNAKHYADYDAAFCNFVRNAPKFNGGRNGVDRSLVKAADRLIERAKAGDFSFGPRPGSIARAVAPDVRLLPERRGD